MEAETLLQMVSFLLLDQAITKRELAYLTRISYRKINAILHRPLDPPKLNNEQLYHLKRLYERLYAYRDRVEEYIVPIYRPRRR